MTPMTTLLSLLSTKALEAISRSLTVIPLNRNDLLEIPGEPSPYVYFIGEGVVSIAAVSGSRCVEIAMIGSEGVVGLGSGESHYKATIIFPGRALRLPRQDLNGAIAASAAFRDLLDRYRSVLEVEIAQSAVALGTAQVPARLSRWLLMVHDRLNSNELHVTHEFLGEALAVRRPTITLTLRDLYDTGAVRLGRNRITIARRDILEEKAGEIYGKPETEYQRLIRDLRRPQ